MFDRVHKTVVEAVYVDQSHKQSMWRWLEATTKITPLLLSLASLVVAWLAFKSNEEGITVDVKRNISAPIGVTEPFGIELNPDLERSDTAYTATWNISLVNTSLTAITPITDFRIFDISFLGNGAIIGPDSAETGLTTADGKKIELPVGIKPGEVLKFQLTAITPISSRAFPKPPIPLPSSPNGAIMIPMGENGLDPFGNEGSSLPAEEWHAAPKADFHEPCVFVSIETGRGNPFNGIGYWYQKVFRQAANGYLEPLTNPRCFNSKMAWVK